MAGVSSGNVRPRYDCVIVGAGPAGLNAGRRLLEVAPDARCLLVDKHTPGEYVKACAEAVGRLGFAEAVPIERAWVRATINRATFHAPAGGAVTYTNPGSGYIIDRARMQRDLARHCMEGGIDCAGGHRVVDVAPGAQGHRQLRFDNGSTTTARVVIDAAGASSLLGKREDITWKAYDAEPAYLAIVEGVAHQSDTVHIYMGESVAPGGYAWLFPSTDNLANVGVLVGNAYRGSVNIRRLLADFIQSRFPGCVVRQYAAGTIACGYRRSVLALPGLIKTGDAAGTTNPISRAGIVEAMKSGMLAAECAAGQLGAATERQTARLCRHYERSWYRLLGRRHQKLLDTKASLQHVPDRDYDSAAETLNAVAQDSLSMTRIFGTALRRFPRLVWAMRHLM